MKIDTFISTDHLASIISSQEILIIDCRFNLADSAWGRSSYQDSHIPGAIFANLETELSGPITHHSGRHPLPATESFTAKISNWGINPDKKVIVYDTDNGSIAARLWWLLNIYGYTQVSILSGGFGQWISEARPVESGYNLPNPSGMNTIQPNHRMYCSTTEVEMIIGNPSFLLIDARSEERFFGKLEPIDPIAGHIPGAKNRFHGLNLHDDGTIKSREQLNNEFHTLLGVTSPTNVVVYCGSGVTSCLHLAAMEYAGLQGARLYPGSWSEWIRDPQHPIARENN